MKTLKDWENSKLDLDDYLKEPTEINEELANYISGCIAPVYSSNEFTQGGDPRKEEHDILFYQTFMYLNGKYFYLGILPEFQQT